jgi:glycosyltransferase involved in cell wall biosynthesis
MDSNIKISIGIPIYNAERFLEFAIRSVLNQSLKEFELILSDDGSSDRSLEIAKSFNDPRIKVLSDGINKGMGQRLNEQIAISKGNYFVRMDADDIMFPNRLEIQLSFLQNNPEIDVVGSYAIVIDDENKILGLRTSTIPNSVKDCFSAVPFIHPSVTGKIDWFRKFQYANYLKGGVEDADLWIRSFNNSNFFIIKEPLIFYRDPLKLKFKVYKCRILQMQIIYKTNFNLLGKSEFNIYYFKFRDFLKLSIYWISKVFMFDGFLIKNRNIRINKNMLKLLHFRVYIP